MLRVILFISLLFSSSYADDIVEKLITAKIANYKDYSELVFLVSPDNQYRNGSLVNKNNALKAVRVYACKNEIFTYTFIGKNPPTQRRFSLGLDNTKTCNTFEFKLYYHDLKKQQIFNYNEDINHHLEAISSVKTTRYAKSELKVEAAFYKNVMKVWNGKIRSFKLGLHLFLPEITRDPKRCRLAIKSYVHLKSLVLFSGSDAKAPFAVITIPANHVINYKLNIFIESKGSEAIVPVTIVAEGLHKKFYKVAKTTLVKVRNGR